MPSSDSEDFESADEGSVEKSERKKRLSSSNYSDNWGSESDQKKTVVPQQPQKQQGPRNASDGWDDFEIDDNEAIVSETTGQKFISPIQKPKQNDPKRESDDTGWDEFDDWGDNTKNVQQQSNTEKNMKEITERLAETSTKPATGGWGWGWNVDSLLSTATAGISTITSQVSQGITTVLETGIGAPDPEELAKQAAKEKESKQLTPEENNPAEKEMSDETQFQFGSLISGVTKFVGTTGTKVIAGGLDTLETIGKKTMEVLQDGDPGLAKKRAMFGLDPGDKPVLSQVLREAKAKADEDDRIREEKREAKEVHYERLFDDFEGLVHLEALEMLSRQATLRIEERMRNVSTEKRQDIKETLQQVAELCEMPEEEDDDESTDAAGSKPDAFLERLQNATEDLGVKLHFQPLITQYTEILDWLSQESLKEKEVYKKAISSVAQATALSVELYHKAAEMLLVKSRRSTADESDALTQMTVVLSKHISELATAFTEKLNAVAENKEQVNNYITNIFLEAGNSSTYIQNAFQLELPILQVGAV